MATFSSAWSSHDISEFHEYCGDATAIVIGTSVAYSAEDTSAVIKVEQWIKSPPSATEAAGPPSTIRLTGNADSATRPADGPIFPQLIKKGRFLIFVFPDGRTRDGQIGRLYDIDEQGRLPKGSHLQGMDPQPKTANEFVAQINRVLSKEFRNELITLLANAEARNPDRAEAARRLGAIRAVEARTSLETEAAKPGTNETEATVRESLRALCRIDQAKAASVCVRIIQNSQHNYQVDNAAWLLGQLPFFQRPLSDEPPPLDPKTAEIVLAAALRWESRAGYVAEHPLPSLIGTLSAAKHSLEFEALVMRCLEKGSGNVVIVSMYAAASHKIRRAVPFICEQLTSKDKIVDVKGSASVAIAILVGNQIASFINQPVTDDEARQCAADAFPDWREDISKALTIECLRGSKILSTTVNGGQAYILVSWKVQPNQVSPQRKAILLYSSVDTESSK